MSVASFHRLTAAQPNLSHDPHRHHAHAFEAIAATLPLDSVGYEPQLNAKGEIQSSAPLPSICDFLRLSSSTTPPAPPLRCRALSQKQLSPLQRSCCDTQASDQPNRAR